MRLKPYLGSTSLQKWNIVFYQFKGEDSRSDQASLFETTVISAKCSITSKLIGAQILHHIPKFRHPSPSGAGIVSM